MPRALCALAMTGGKGCGDTRGCHRTRIFVGQGPCALPGVRHKTGGRTEASAPTEEYLVVRRGGALLPTVVPAD